MNRPAVRDAALLIFRAVLGLIFIAHGVDKMFMTGMDETVGQFSALGVPAVHSSSLVCSPPLSPGHSHCLWGVPCISCTWAMGFLLPTAESNTHWYCCYPC